MAYTKKTTHKEEGLANLVDQFKDKPKIRALLGIYLDQVQALENAFCDILLKTELNPSVVYTLTTEAGDTLITEAGDTLTTE